MIIIYIYIYIYIYINLYMYIYVYINDGALSNNNNDFYLLDFVTKGSILEIPMSKARREKRNTYGKQSFLRVS